MYNPYSHLVYSAGGADVSHSIINGRLVMEDRRLLTLNLEDILSRARKKAALVRQWLSPIIVEDTLFSPFCALITWNTCIFIFRISYDPTRPG